MSIYLHLYDEAISIFGLLFIFYLFFYIRLIYNLLRIHLLNTLTNLIDAARIYEIK